MNFDRLRSVLDVDHLQDAHVTLVGGGASAGLACDLARCGIADFTIVDPDALEDVNLARQGHQARHVGRPKVEALAALIRQVNPVAHVRGLAADFTKFSDAEVDEEFGHTDLFLFCTDRFAAQAFGNEVALRLGKSALWIGLYQGGGAGEIVIWHPDLKPCFRCLCAARYRAHAAAAAAGKTLDPSSDGADIFAIHYLDSIAGMIALGLLTRGADNRYGRLIAELGDRNFLQVKIDPHWSLRGSDIIRHYLQIPDLCDRYFAWNAIARRDPDGGEPPCPDCEKYRGRVAAKASAVATVM